MIFPIVFFLVFCSKQCFCNVTQETNKRKGTESTVTIASLTNITKSSVSVVATAPIAFYYDYFNNRDPSTNSLATPTGVEPVFGGNCGNLAVPVYIPSSGTMSATSFRMKPNDGCTCAEECMSVENIINAFNMGIPYIHIDEVSYDHPCPECASIIQQVGDAGYPGRIIVFLRYSLSGIGLSDQKPIIDLAMKGYVRKLLFETYPSSNSQCPSYLCTSTSGNAVTDLNTWATVIDNVYPGSNAVFAPTFGLRPGIELDYCQNDLSAITSYFSAMHQYFPFWTGAAWFGAHECCACSGYYSYNDMAQHCAGLVSWWG